MSLPRKSSRCSRAPEMECVEYWKTNSRAAAAESAADTFPSGRCGAVGRLQIEAKILSVFHSPQ
jgi:hypothetical protein